MNYRRHLSVGTLAIVIAAGSMLAVPVAGQAQTATTATYTPPHTPWGDPDLQGIYYFNSSVPLQRPDDLAGKSTLTDTELAAFTKQRQSAQGVESADWHPRIPWIKDNRTSLITDPPDGKIPLSAEGRKKFEALEEYRRLHQNAYESWVEVGSYERCISRVIPRLFQRYNNGIQIVQGPGYVALVYEQFDQRIIPLDGRAPLDAQVRQWNGDSRGHWEGDTLVVEVTNFNDKQTAWPPMRNQESEFTEQGAQLGHTGVPRGNLKMIERYRPISATHVEYTVTNEDPTWFSRPWTLMQTWAKYEEYQQYEYACSEGNVGMENSLRGARINELIGKPYQPPAKAGDDLSFGR